MLLAIEPEGELAAPSPAGVRLLGIEASRQRTFPTMRHVFDLGEEAGLHVEIGALGHAWAFAVTYDNWGDERLLAL